MAFQYEEESVEAQIAEMRQLLDKVYTDGYDHCKLTSTLDEDDVVGHNCAWCCFDDSIQTLTSLINSLAPTDMSTLQYWRISILNLHVIAQELHHILAISGLTHDYIKENHSVIYEIKRYANFLKHPKVRLFLQHPQYITPLSHTKENNSYQKLVTKVEASRGSSSTMFTKKEIDRFYAGEGKEAQLYDQFKNKENVIVVLPSVVDITDSLLECLKEIIKTFESNPILEKQLSQYAIAEQGYLDDLVHSYIDSFQDIGR